MASQEILIGIVGEEIESGGGAQQADAMPRMKPSISVATTLIQNPP